MSIPETAHPSRPEPFAAQGTLFALGIRRFTNVAESFSADRTVELANRHLDHVTRAIAKHGGEVHQFIGDAVVAYWLDGSTSGACAAFACSLDLLADPMPAKMEKGVAYDLNISLATGEIVGAYFGPIQQFQLIGAAKNISDRLSSGPGMGHGLRLCQYTASKLASTDLISPIASVERAGLEPLVVHGLKKAVRPEAAPWWRWR
ncbi:MAG: adenylate/guanylate cyclase domain-containing protein [Betaproteobacteria bacterium]|nr:adenylate/guanylate cyclase domain-containing protein [Betaproteobacteria bacterium]